MTLIEKTIIATLSYYDILDYPLTGFEIWRHLICAKDFEKDKFEVGDLFAVLSESELLQEKISQKFGFYFLCGREDIVEKRLWRKKLADQKWKKLRRVFKILIIVPFVRGIFVSGSLALENSKDDSDVDIIVVAKYGRIWTVRTLMTALTFILGVRRYGKKTKDRICLNHYITDKSLQIPFESIYNAESYVHLVNVYAEDESIFRKFQLQNDWLRKYVINHKPGELKSVRTLRKNKILLSASKLMEFPLWGIFGDVLEDVFLKIESRRICKDSLYDKAGGRITIDDTQLEFHPDSHEYLIIPEFNRRMENLGLLEFAGQKDSGLNK
jgi:predicted nucleotidyltransferase